MDLEMLNRLRVNAGKSELGSWKASKVKLVEAVKSLQAAGYTDALPGANLAAKPKTDDPVIAKVLPKEEETPKPKKSKGLHPAIKSVTSTDHKTVEIKSEPKKEPVVTSGKAKLARGLETESMARQSRIAIQMDREREKRESDKVKSETKAAAKEEKAAAKKDKPKKTKTNKKSVFTKAPKNDNEVTVADICRELDIDPKIGRAKLRRHTDKLAKLYAKGVTEGWTFPIAAKAALINILK